MKSYDTTAIVVIKIAKMGIEQRSKRLASEPWTAALAEGEVVDSVAAAAEIEDEVIAALKPNDPEPLDLTAVELESGVSELPLVGDGPVDIVLDVMGPESEAREEVAGEPLELVLRRVADHKR